MKAGEQTPIRRPSDSLPLSLPSLATNAELRTQLLHWILLGSIAVMALLIGANLLFVSGGTLAPQRSQAAILAICVVAWIVLRLGDARAATAIFLLGTWSAIVFALALDPENPGPGYASLLLVVVIAGFVWTSRSGVGLAALSSVALFWLLGRAAGTDSWLLTGFPLRQWLGYTAILVIGALFLHLAHRMLDRSRHAAQLSVALMEGEARRRQQAERSLADARKLEALGRLAGGIAHDFNNLLTVVRGSAELAELVADGPESDHHKIRGLLRDIKAASTRGADLTRQLLVFSRRQPGDPQVLDANLAIEALSSILRRLIRENIDLHFELEPELPCVRIDPARLDQILINLVVNARDAMPDGGKLLISTRTLEIGAPAADSSPADNSITVGKASGRRVCLEFIDSGHGIQPEEISKVFEPFYSTKEPGAGTGLGLATVQGIVTRAGGSVTVTSEPGQSTAVLVLLPATEERPPHVRLPSGSRRQHETRSVLLCEDDPGIVDVMERLLTSEGYRVTATSRPAVALEKAATLDRLDVLVTDVVMPGMSGTELARLLREARPELRVIYLSGYDAAELGHELGDDRVVLLQKPFDGAELVSLIEASTGTVGELP